MQKNIIPEDWEKESQKESVYLLEQRMLEEQEVMRLINEEESKRKPAQIHITAPETPDKHEEEIKSDVLPF